MKNQRKAGRPQKKDFQQAEKQKGMKELEVEITVGSLFSSENYLLLYCALLIYGQGCPEKGNKYIVKQYSQGEKDLDVAAKVAEIERGSEVQRMWLLYWKISRILNKEAKNLLMELWDQFQEILESEEYESKELENIQSIRNIFIENKPLSSVSLSHKYHLFTKDCFDPQKQEEENDDNDNDVDSDISDEHFEVRKKMKQEDQAGANNLTSNKKKMVPSKKKRDLSNSKKEQKIQSKNKKSINSHFDYQSFEKHLLHLHKFQKNDFLAILFSCASAEYFNFQSPYFDSFCNIL